MTDDDGSIFINRELSWLDFNERVLSKSGEENIPLMERFRFLSIYSSNLDEFFMIRIGTLFDQMLLKEKVVDNKTGMSAKAQINAALEKTRKLNRQKDKLFGCVEKTVSQSAVERINFDMLSARQEKYWQKYFEENIVPLLSPQIIDRRTPYPFLKNGELYIYMQLCRKNGDICYGIVPVLTQLGRVIRAPLEDRKYLLAEDIVKRYAHLIFEKYKVVQRVVLRITRNADISLDEGIFDYSIDYLEAMKQLLKKRRRLMPVRVQLSNEVSEDFEKHLTGALKVERNQIFAEESPLDLTYINKVIDFANKRRCPELFYPIKPVRRADVSYDVIKAIREKDILLSFPYESFSYVTSLIEQAACNPEVAAIKITLYRVANDSKVVAALIKAAENGKDVTAVLELRARFDEENNIEWAQRLEDVGCTVIYGLGDYKIHSKLLLLVMRSATKINYISYISTGNFNEKTAELYTDIGLMTADRRISEEILELFRAISFSQLVEKSDSLLVAPLVLKPRIEELIDREIYFAKKGEPAEIKIKCNSVSDKEIINKLVEASRAGVSIKMLVRGICCIRPAVAGYTDNIEVFSIVGRLLEHSRIFVFGCGERREVYISSADLLTRNTQRRVETAVRINDRDYAQLLSNTIDIMLSDTANMRVLGNDGVYRRAEQKSGERIFDSQDYFFDYYARQSDRKLLPQKTGLLGLLCKYKKHGK
ncbi:MAG: polyphosphate kinase 1 [Oscillospiraceae bacterium]